MSMQDVLSVMIPGQSYSFEDICAELEKNGYRITSTSTVLDNVYKLVKKGYVISISGIYIRTDSVEDFPPTYIGAVREIISVMIPGNVYDTRTIKDLRMTEGFETLPRSVLKAYMDYMVKVEILESVGSEGYRLLEQKEE